MSTATDRQLIVAITTAIIHATGRHYRINLEALDTASLREVLRLLQDVEHEKRMAAQRAQRMPWRRV